MSAGTPWTIATVRDALLAKKTSARELAKDFYARIERRNPELNAFLALCPERAYAQADRVDAAVAQGQPLPPLAGVPVATKDVISTRGVRTTCGSKILENYTPPYDATAIERLENAGAVILGKTNCDEFAMGSSNENSAYGPVRNPVALDRVPGGSSGGSAAAVAAGLSVRPSLLRLRMARVRAVSSPRTRTTGPSNRRSPSRIWATTGWRRRTSSTTSTPSRRSTSPRTSKHRS